MVYELSMHGVIPMSDQKKARMRAVEDACLDAGIEIPDEVKNYLDTDTREICPRGELIPLVVEDVYEDGEAIQYINLKTLNPNITYIRLWHSY